ncbi:hypothetical protein AX17_005480 [Amanita inopinata Kibby_2008]|nr:hypothetical protein AX17_005480 [Amanita inopinata Kibby_2008]
MSSPTRATGSSPTHTTTRRRAHILEKAQSQLPTPSCRLNPRKDGKRRVSQTTEETSPSWPTDYESQSESSIELAAAVEEADFVHSAGGEHTESQLDAKAPHNHIHRHTKKTTGKVRSRSWYEFDLAVVVALVSPVGHWLTGGDHIKNLLLVVLLVYYLHQIIEIPWVLYQKARPQKTLPLLPPTSIEEKYQQIAASELHRLELFFLSLTAISPFLGATFLRYATSTTIGPQALSWFNTALFVLATGMRPWAHIVERLKQRTSDLHDVIDHAAPNSNMSTRDELMERIDEITKRVHQLEKMLKKQNTKTAELVADVYSCVDEAVEQMEKSIRRHDKRHAKHETRIKDMEDTLAHMNSSQAKQKMRIGVRLLPISLFRYLVPSWLYWPSYRALVGAVSSHPAPPTNGNKSLLQSFSSHSSPTRSSPIPQLDYVREDETRVYPMLARPTFVTSGLLFRLGYVVTMPLRAVVRMILRRY